MSLDVYLKTDGIRQRTGSGIFIREHGETFEIDEDEWRYRNPGQEPMRLSQIKENDEVYSANITHNLGKMAGEAGIYQHLWRPEELGITHAWQLVEPLRDGLNKMKDDPAHYEQFNASNGWGLYKHFVPWIERYLQACKEYPDAKVSVSR